MKLGIIAAMSEELDLLLQDMKLKQKQTIANITFNEGTLFDKDVVAVVCGIGKVNAAICTQILITSFGKHWTRSSNSKINYDTTQRRCVGKE